jgi:hypothetical protein
MVMMMDSKEDLLGERASLFSIRSYFQTSKLAPVGVTTTIESPFST